MACPRHVNVVEQLLTRPKNEVEKNMLKRHLIIINLLVTITLCTPSFADPWFTGPLLAPAGKTMPLGAANLETYGFFTTNDGIYNSKGAKIRTPLFATKQLNPLFTYGLADGVDAQLSVPYSFNQSQGVKRQHIADTSVLLGFQALKQRPDAYLPNLRITAQQIFPTGRFDSFNPTDHGTGTTGSGGYQSVITFNFQYLQQLTELHYLRGRLSLAYLHAFPYVLQSEFLNHPAPQVNGTVQPGDLVSGDIAVEYTLSQNWVAVMEAYSFFHQASSFSGYAAIDENGQLTLVGHQDLFAVTLAPAIEYNITQQYGIIAGYWLSVKGRNVPAFGSFVIAINAVW